MLIIGDVHGKINRYNKIVNKTTMQTIQVGDFGFKTHHDWHIENIDPSKHKINFGNHDYYPYLNKPHSLSNYSVSGELMTVRGAYSIDQYKRTEGLDWFNNEELNYGEMQEAIDQYIDNKPKIMITHDCPQIIRQHLFGISEKSITSNGLEAMFEIHKPDVWVFGHHHRSKDVNILGTRFICLAELETFSI